MNNEQYDQIIDEVYQNYSKKNFNDWEPGMEYLSKESFVNKCKTDIEFSNQWGLKIKERKILLDDRTSIKVIDVYHKPNKSPEFIELKMTILPTGQKFEDE